MRLCSCFCHWLLFFFLVNINTALAQNPPSLNSDNLISLTVTVSTPKGRLVGGLTKEDLLISTERSNRPIRSLGAMDEPIAVGILVDTSGSMNTPGAREIAGREKIIESLSTFIELGNPKNRYFLMSFGSQLNLLSDWSNDLRPSLAGIPTAHDKSKTAFFDALWGAIDKVKSGSHRKRVVLVISDGLDNGSRHKLDDVRNLLKANDVLVYSLGITGPATDPTSLGFPGLANIINVRITSGGSRALIDFAEITGGLALFVHDDKQMNWLANRVATELRNQYRVEFESGPAKPGSWERVKAKIKPRENATAEFRKLQLRTRQGYYSGTDRKK